VSAHSSFRMSAASECHGASCGKHRPASALPAPESQLASPTIRQNFIIDICARQRVKIDHVIARDSPSSIINRVAGRCARVVNRADAWRDETSRRGSRIDPQLPFVLCVEDPLWRGSCHSPCRKQKRSAMSRSLAVSRSGHSSVDHPDPLNAEARVLAESRDRKIPRTRLSALLSAGDQSISPPSYTPA